jgi:tetratricopeptide (TPR) repeat protein
MAYLDSSQEAALAFAQVSTMVGFLLQNAGEESLPELMDRVRDGEDPNAAFAAIAGYPDWPSFLDGWKAWLATLPLVKQTLAQVPVVLDGDADEFASDPLFADRPDLARFTRVGDLLRSRGHFEAALVEYGKAEDPEGPPSPLLLARKAECHLSLGDEASALRDVRTGTRLYPEVPVLQVTLGRILESQGQLRQAAAAFAVAQDINPYNPEVQQALVRLYEALGRTALAQRHKRYATILATGGAAAQPASPADPVR